MAAFSWRRLVAGWAVLALALAASGQVGEGGGGEPASEPEGALKRPIRRIASSFDFEEHDNPYPVPRHWVRAQDSDRLDRPGFPHYNEAEFDFTVSHSGDASVRLPAKGGSTSLRLSAGVIPVFAEGDYSVNAWVRTAGLRHARAFVRARMLDQASAVIPGTEVVSGPLDSPGEWTEVSLQMIGAPMNAAFLQIELQLLQPRQFRVGMKDGAHAVWMEDLHGEAWFDDLVVYQLPRVEITTGAPANIVLTPDRPVIRILVRDFVGEKLDGRIVVTDVDDRVIEDVHASLATSGRPQEWTLNLPALGWYRVRLSVLGEKPDGSPYRVGGAELHFLWLDRGGVGGGGGGVGGVGETRAGVGDAGAGIGAPGGTHVPEGPRADRRRFGTIADRIEPEIINSLDDAARVSGAGFVSIPVWGAGGPEDDVAARLRLFGRLLDDMSKADQQVIVCIGSVAPSLLAQFPLTADDPLGMADVDPKEWMPAILPILDRYGQRLTRWQVGLTGTDGAFWRPNVIASSNTFQTQLATLVPGPRIGIPWSAEFALPADIRGGAGRAGDRGVSTLVVTYPAAFGAESLRGFLDGLAPQATAGAAPGEIMIVPELPATSVYGERTAATELGRRAIEFWAARTSPEHAAKLLSLAVSHPWRAMGEHRKQMMPSAALGAYQTLIAHLSERDVVGEYAVTPGVKCYILADRHTNGTERVTGALVAWNETAAPEEAVIRRFLGTGAIETVDLFGNRTPIEPRATPGAPHEIRVGESPVFIEGADPMLARFCTLLRVEPPFVPAVQTEHELVLTLTNPWPQAISGKLQIVPPTGLDGSEAKRRWTITPDGIIPFSLGAGQTKRIPWTVAFPYFEETGEKSFNVVVRVATDRELPPIVVPLSVQVGLRDLALEPDVQVGPALDGPDVILTCTVANKGGRTRMLKLEAVAQGIPTQQTTITDLPAGEMVVKRIVLKDAAALLSGKRIHISLTDGEEQERLNTSVRVP